MLSLSQQEKSLQCSEMFITFYAGGNNSQIASVWNRKWKTSYNHIFDGCVFSLQSDGVAVGFISVTADVDVKRLHDSFELSEFDGLYKLQETKNDEPDTHSDTREDEEALRQTQTSDSQQVTHTSLNTNLMFMVSILQ